MNEHHSADNSNQLVDNPAKRTFSAFPTSTHHIKVVTRGHVSDPVTVVAPVESAAPVEAVRSIAPVGQSSPRLVEPTDSTPSAALVNTARASWIRNYQIGLLALDGAVACATVLASLVLRFGAISPPHGHADLALAAFFPLLWVAVIGINRGYESRFLGAGSTEFQRLFQGFLYVTAIVSFASMVFQADLARGFILLALPLVILSNLLTRYAARKWLHAQRAKGRFMTSVLLVGDAPTIVEFNRLLGRDRHAGLRVVGGCVPSELVADQATQAQLKDAGIGLLGDVDSILAAVAGSGADTVAVVSSQAIGTEKLRWISWQLEGSETSLVVSPGLVETAGPRLHIQPMAGLPLVHVEEPEFRGFRRVCKSAFDRSVAAGALLVLAPLFVGLAIAVRLNSPGPALFRQARVGRDGRTFTMLKFRSMFVDAETRLSHLQQTNDHGSNGVLFKMRTDPRITRIGALLRKYSLDELPQLINVLNGSMSLVGPRPPLQSEVDRYELHVHRKFLVKPGLTGLWQISGRSDLAWDESVRLDLRYVENWSIMGDLQILWKTIFAVLGGDGAY